MKLTGRAIRASLIALSVLVYTLATVLPSFSYSNYLREAQSKGYPAQNCSYCHSSIGGGSGWNERGRWLIEQKKKHNAEEIRIAWLKDYKPAESKGSTAQPQTTAKDAQQATKTKAPPKAKAKAKSRIAKKTS